MFKRVAMRCILLITLTLLVFLPSSAKYNNYVVSAETMQTCGPMDVAFAVDTSTSMEDAIDNVKSELEGILNRIEVASGNDYRLSLVTFADVELAIK